MKALIAPNEAPVKYIASWSSTTPPFPTYWDYPNSCRVAQVEPDDQTFPVADPYFWTNCADDIVADQFYYDTVTKKINLIVNAPMPVQPDQPATTGTQTIGA